MEAPSWLCTSVFNCDGHLPSMLQVHIFCTQSLYEVMPVSRAAVKQLYRSLLRYGDSLQLTDRQFYYSRLRQEFEMAKELDAESQEKVYKVMSIKFTRFMFAKYWCIRIVVYNKNNLAECFLGENCTIALKVKNCSSFFPLWNVVYKLYMYKLAQFSAIGHPLFCAQVW